MESIAGLVSSTTTSLTRFVFHLSHLDQVGLPQARRAVEEGSKVVVGDGKTLFVDRFQKRAERAAMLAQKYEDIRREKNEKYKHLNLYVKNLEVSRHFCESTFILQLCPRRMWMTSSSRKCFQSLERSPLPLS